MEMLNNRKILQAQEDMIQIIRHAVESGMRDLRTDGFQKAAEGLTTVEEILRVTES